MSAFIRPHTGYYAFFSQVIEDGSYGLYGRITEFCQFRNT